MMRIVLDGLKTLSPILIGLGVTAVATSFLGPTFSAVIGVTAFILVVAYVIGRVKQMDRKQDTEIDRVKAEHSVDVDRSTKEHGEVMRELDRR